MGFEMKENFFSCKCDTKKSHKLILDGGVLENYYLILCDDCYLKQTKKFLIREEMIENNLT